MSAAAVLEVRAGVDLVDAATVRASIEVFGDRYLRRVYTAHELECCQAPEPVRSRSLAARFAAKEAALKVIGLDDDAMDWRDIEVRRRGNGAPELVLHRAAAVLAERAGVTSTSLSLSHEGDIAAAFVVGGVACSTTAPPSSTTEQHHRRPRRATT